MAGLWQLGYLTNQLELQLVYKFTLIIKIRINFQNKCMLIITIISNSINLVINFQKQKLFKLFGKKMSPISLQYVPGMAKNPINGC